MNYLFFILLFAMSVNSSTIFDFTTESNIQEWRVVDDGVMGGRSQGDFGLNSDGFGSFSGDVSLENNGGFSSVRYRFDKIKVKQQTKIRLKVKGDGKEYQFRIKANSRDYYVYKSTFTTSGEWQDIEISLSDMHPSFRGRNLDQPNFDKDSFEEIAFLIANKKAEKFILLIDEIVLE